MKKVLALFTLPFSPLSCNEGALKDLPEQGFFWWASGVRGLFR